MVWYLVLYEGSCVDEGYPTSHGLADRSEYSQQGAHQANRTTNLRASLTRVKMS